jgi:hypothetical protein
MKDMERQTVNTYIHRRQDGTAEVVRADPMVHLGMHRALRRMCEYRKGVNAACSGR